MEFFVIRNTTFVDQKINRNLYQNTFNEMIDENNAIAISFTTYKAVKNYDANSIGH